MILRGSASAGIALEIANLICICLALSFGKLDSFLIDLLTFSLEDITWLHNQKFAKPIKYIKIYPLRPFVPVGTYSTTRHSTLLPERNEPATCMLAGSFLSMK